MPVKRSQAQKEAEKRYRSKLKAVTLHLPVDLHLSLQEVANKEGISLHKLLLNAAKKAGAE